MGRRAFRRAVSDAAMGLLRPMLTYKAARRGVPVTVVDRWFPSSQLHHGCFLTDGTQCRLVGEGRVDKQLLCPRTGKLVDRDHNAAPNLRDWPGHANRRTVGAAVPLVSSSVSSGGDRGSDPLLDR
jgi:putative transposase